MGISAGEYDEEGISYFISVEFIAIWWQQGGLNELSDFKLGPVGTFTH